MPQAVYPRECGGTGAFSCAIVRAIGLSPRVRGNPSGRDIGPSFHGSIPASAGEPRCYAIPWPLERVYPRECGGTMTFTCKHCPATGLSPRVRGNRWYSGLAALRGGSIPASAGEPNGQGVSENSKWVYPRECGGTDEIQKMALRTGVYPRECGEPSCKRYNGVPARSIPASAGEPGSLPRQGVVFRLSPRGRGTTQRGCLMDTW